MCYDKESYIAGLLAAKIECSAAIDVMQMVYQGIDEDKLSGALEGINQAMILIEDLIISGR